MRGIMAYLAADELRAMGLPGAAIHMEGDSVILRDHHGSARRIGIVRAIRDHAYLDPRDPCAMRPKRVTWRAETDYATVATMATRTGAICALVEYDQRGQGA